MAKVPYAQSTDLDWFEDMDVIAARKLQRFTYPCSRWRKRQRKMVVKMALQNSELKAMNVEDIGTWECMAAYVRVARTVSKTTYVGNRNSL